MPLLHPLFAEICASIAPKEVDVQDTRDINALHEWLDLRGVPRFDETDAAFQDFARPLKLSDRVLRLYRDARSKGMNEGLDWVEVSKRTAREEAILECAVLVHETSCHKGEEIAVRMGLTAEDFHSALAATYRDDEPEYEDRWTA